MHRIVTSPIPRGCYSISSTAGAGFSILVNTSMLVVRNRTSLTLNAIPTDHGARSAGSTPRAVDLDEDAPSSSVGAQGENLAGVEQ
jgi:hypothetical protein